MLFEINKGRHIYQVFQYFQKRFLIGKNNKEQKSKNCRKYISNKFEPLYNLLYNSNVIITIYGPTQAKVNIFIKFSIIKNIFQNFQKKFSLDKLD